MKEKAENLSERDNAQHRETTSNLIPFNRMTAERQRELSKKGGKASGAARRKRRAQIEAAKAEIIALAELERSAERRQRTKRKIIQTQ